MSRTIISRSLYDWRDHYKNRPLAIVAPGPSYDRVPRDVWFNAPVVFALNAAIVETFRHDNAYWVSNDHDRTFGSNHIRGAIAPRLRPYRPWRTITNQKFIPGNLGDIDWVDHHGRQQGPTEWRLPAPDGSEVWYYHENEGFPNYCYHGESVLELALEVATIWGFKPIVCVGVDLTMVNEGRRKAIPTPRAQADGGVYYSRQWSWKGTPARIYRGKLNRIRGSIRRNRDRWPDWVYLVRSFWNDSPFRTASAEETQEMLCGKPQSSLKS